MKEGFYTALGTPLDESGNLIPASLAEHVEDQVSAGASGLLVMGSMGIEAYVKTSEYAKVAETAVEAAKGACPVLVGGMDNSISRVMDRVNSLASLSIDGVICTTPFYSTLMQEEVKEFYQRLAGLSPFPLYLYDLAAVTKTRINPETAKFLMTVDNINGIKSGDIITARTLLCSPDRKDDFSIVFSGLDIFDLAYKFGLTMNLDGMFSCTAAITSRMYSCFKQGNFSAGGKLLEDILSLRGAFFESGNVMSGFTCSMNLLGFEGNFAPDYCLKPSVEKQERIKTVMKNINLL